MDVDPLGIVKAPVTYPKMYEVEQRWSATKIGDFRRAVGDALLQSGAGMRLRPGMTVAVTAGSRGIRNIATILAEAVRWLKEQGVVPFVVAAMGSHGGGTAEGQRSVLRSLGITRTTIGCAIVASDKVRLVGTTPSGHRVYCDKDAYEADAIVVINRIKPHTSFKGPIESGLCKMLSVGLGKTEGATYVHLLGASKMAEAIPSMAEVLLNTQKVVGGIAIIENAEDETAELIGVRPEDIRRREPELLEKAKRMMPSLPVQTLDVLIVGQMGKNFSGTGMDTNVLGRYQIDGLADPPTPDIRRIAVLDLSDESFGNATGLSLADVCTKRVARKFDRKSTYLNCFTSTFLHRAAIPPVMDNDWAAIGLLVRVCGVHDTSNMKMAMIRNTLDMKTLWVSQSLLDEVESKGHKVARSHPIQVRFDSEHNLESPDLFAGVR